MQTRSSDPSNQLPKTELPSSTEEFKMESYELTSSVTDIEFEHISCLFVRSPTKMIIGGRWFGIYECEKDNSDNTIMTKKKLVDSCKIKSQIVFLIVLFSPQ